MDKPHNQARIVTIHQMLFEMARGNFNSRIPSSTNDEENDELETLIVLINMVAEEMKESIFNLGFVNSHSTHQFITQTTILLDEKYSIESFTPELILLLGYTESELFKQPLTDIIANTSLDQIEKLLETSLPAVVALDFIRKDQLPISVSCSVGKLINESKIILNLLTPKKYDAYYPMAIEDENEKQSKPRKFDAFLIQKLYDYILAHLEDPLPSLKILARKFGTNEHKLKDGFRHFFKTSIYQFYNDERLKRAYFMIEHTAIPLKNISVMNGFNNYPNFSKSFKKRFGFSPYEVKRNEIGFTPPQED
ncbi:helix-turn-helix domain-containing protein [Flavobacterium eburneipallidum]|uniref:helix-turn-helix domain-containing protein n=1 Tax=Flavobacterium eburneipallidum TaxID=3003263 RepID=UPI0024825A6B|nr:AraC family transcriptional regulator [Flavobacterium eburneipallidum]